MEVLPRLRAGVVVHFHDIFWPLDYPPEWNDRYYGIYLLGRGMGKVKVLLPNAFVTQDPELARVCAPLGEIPGIYGPYNAHCSPHGLEGGSFWLQLA
jgi:hypothetical protein